MNRIRVAIRNEAVSLRRAQWLTSVFQKSDPDLHVELAPVDPGIPRGGVPRLAGRDDSAVGSLWEALRDESADMAWFDLRHAPPEMPGDIEITGWAPRLNPRYGLIHGENLPFRDLPEGARISTADALAHAQIRSMYPHLEWVTIEGDLPARLHKVHLRQTDCSVEPAADLLALGFGEHAFDFIGVDIAVSAAGQSIWVLCARVGGNPVAIPDDLQDERARMHGETERLVVQHLAAADNVPVGVLARSQRGRLLIEAAAVPNAGAPPERARITGPPEQRDELAAGLAAMLQQRGISRGRASRGR
jgi:hydroxymethylbilane synthase